MTKKKLQEQIYQELAEWELPEKTCEQVACGDNGSYLLLQKKPYTAIYLKWFYGDKLFKSMSFAKVRYPDTWDAEEGVKLCLRKTSADLARQILGIS